MIFQHNLLQRKLTQHGKHENYVRRVHVMRVYGSSLCKYSKINLFNSNTFLKIMRVNNNRIYCTRMTLLLTY